MLLEWLSERGMPFNKALRFAFSYMAKDKSN